MAALSFHEGVSVSRYCEWFRESCVAAQELKLCSFPKTSMHTDIYNVGSRTL